jgi:UDP:flavonoid glycosyltransferase YjiC (YdhE family)
VERCRLVVHHGGAGTSWATLAAGVPAVCLPQAGDQFRNAEILEWWGAAFVVPPENLDAIGETVSAALIDDGIPAGAEAARGLNSRLPPTTALVDLVESVVR